MCFKLQPWKCILFSRNYGVESFNQQLDGLSDFAVTYSLSSTCFEGAITGLSSNARRSPSGAKRPPGLPVNEVNRMGHFLCHFGGTGWERTNSREPIGNSWPRPRDELSISRQPTKCVHPVGLGRAILRISCCNL